jgi:hypothetical protein
MSCPICRVSPDCSGSRDRASKRILCPSLAQRGEKIAEREVAGAAILVLPAGSAILAATAWSGQSIGLRAEALGAALVMRFANGLRWMATMQATAILRHVATQVRQQRCFLLPGLHVWRTRRQSGFRLRFRFAALPAEKPRYEASALPAARPMPRRVQAAYRIRLMDESFPHGAMHAGMTDELVAAVPAPQPPCGGWGERFRGERDWVSESAAHASAENSAQLTVGFQSANMPWGLSCPAHTCNS